MIIFYSLFYTYTFNTCVNLKLLIFNSIFAYCLYKRTRLVNHYNIQLLDYEANVNIFLSQIINNLSI